MDCLARTGVTIVFMQALQLVLGLGLIVLRLILCRNFVGAPVPSKVPSAGVRQVRNWSINNGSLASHDHSPPEGTFGMTGTLISLLALSLTYI